MSVVDEFLTTEGIIVLVYIIGIFLIGLLGARRTKNFRDYVTTSSSLGLVLLAGTTLATQWGGITLLGIVGFGYQDLYYGSLYSLGAAIRFMFWAFLLAIVIRKVNPFTISEWFGLRFDGKNAVVMTIMNLIVGLGLLGSQFVAFGTVITVFFDVPFETSIVAGAVIVTAYTIIGGMWGIAYTDFIQVAITAAGAFGMVAWLSFDRGGFSELRTEAVYPAEYFDPNVLPIGDLNMGWLFFLTLIFLWSADLFMNQFTQRISSARNMRIVYWAPVFGAMSYLIVAYVSPAIGAYGRLILGEGIENPDFVFPELAAEALPIWIAGIIAAALLAVVMSSGDAYLLGPSALAANDLYRAYNPAASERQVLIVGRLVTLAYAGIALASALFFQTIIDLILAYLTIGFAVIPALWASLAWRKASSNAAFASMVVGGATNAGLFLFGQGLFPWEMPPYYVGWVGFFIALIILIGLSLIEDRPAIDAVSRGSDDPAVATDGGATTDTGETASEAALADKARSMIKTVQY